MIIGGSSKDQKLDGGEVPNGQEKDEVKKDEVVGEEPANQEEEMKLTLDPKDI
jgi:hypothetical protein